jgi:hypothetical protein
MIDVVIQDENGREISRCARALPASALEYADEEGSCLHFVDPYGDTIFNQRQIPVLVVELMNLVLESEDQESASSETESRAI